MLATFMALLDVNIDFDVSKNMEVKVGFVICCV